jgi:hypothetical protein
MNSPIFVLPGTGHHTLTLEGPPGAAQIASGVSFDTTHKPQGTRVVVINSNKCGSYRKEPVRLLSKGTSVVVTERSQCGCYRKETSEVVIERNQCGCHRKETTSVTSSAQTIRRGDPG